MNEPYAVYYCNNLLDFALYYITNMTQTILETLDIDRCTKTKYRTTMCKVGVATAFSAVLSWYQFWRSIFISVYSQRFHQISITHSKWPGFFKFKKQSDTEFFSTQLWRCVPRLVSKYKAKPPLEFIAPFSQISGFAGRKTYNYISTFDIGFWILSDLIEAKNSQISSVAKVWLKHCSLSK
jgi:hypothetical protein